MSRMSRGAVVLTLAAGCAAPPMSARDVARDSGRERAAEWEVPARTNDDSESRAPTISIVTPTERGETQRIGAEPAHASFVRPPTRGKIDVDLKGAAIGDALRFIADTGGFNLVVEGDAATPITVVLHRVDAFDALMVVAETHGLEVDFDRGIVIVRPPKKPDATARLSPNEE
jgi:hypothetical protein